MRIVYITPGFGGAFYCQNGLRDQALITELRRIGHEITMVPMYLPLSADEPGGPLFFGAISFYLQEQLPLFKRIPAWGERLLNSRFFLQWAAKQAGTSRAEGTEKITLAMLREVDGLQNQEMNRLITWLKNEIRPEVVHLSNALIIGLAPSIKRQLGVPVFCTLQDEDSWLDALAEPFSKMGWEEMKNSAAAVDAFVAVSDYYRDFIRRKLNSPGFPIQVIPVGVNPANYQKAPLSFEPPVVGYLSRLSKAGGLEILVEAFIRLKQEPRFAKLRLRAMGGMTGDDRKFLNRMEKKLRENQASQAVEFFRDFDSESRFDFFQSLSVLTVPVEGGEAFGAYQIEALASGVPIVQPNVGAFPEIVQATGGGLLYEPNDPETLARTLMRLLDDPAWARTLGEQGRVAVTKNYHIEQIAGRMVALYQSYIKPGAIVAEGVD
ncbi:MAG TPA: glycosyltransferase family 4 protein [Bacillota bacterium]|nr:glycosyltransferase family 4 protein [Bacillota bacterium]